MRATSAFFQAQRALLIGYSISLVLFGLCFVLAPEILINNAGFSYFGIIAKTFPFYALAILVVSGAYFIAAHAIFSVSGFRLERWSFLLIGLIIVGVLLTPYSVSPLMAKLHEDFGTTLFIVQLTLSGWWSIKRRLAGSASALFIIQALAGLATLLWIHHVILFGILSQAVFQTIFSFTILAVLASA